MAEGLPIGLVTNSEAIMGDIQGVDHIDAEDLAHLWRVYSTNRNLLANDVGRRLENFFWRIWSNGQIRETIRGTQIARHFVAISEGDVVIRTTPTSSPRASRILPTFHLADRLGSSTTSAAESFVEPQLAGIDERLERQRAVRDPDNVAGQPSQPPTIEEEKGRRRGSSRPPPILKKPRTDSTAQQSKTARILTPTWKTPSRDSRDDTSSPQASSSRSFQPPATENTRPAPSEAPPPTTSSTSTKAPKKKPTFTASSSSTKRRPALPHRKSSNSTPVSKTPSPRLASQNTHSPPPPLPSLSTITRTTNAYENNGALSSAPFPSSKSQIPLRPRSPPPPSELTHPQNPALGRRPTSRSASPVSSTPFHRPSRDHLPMHSLPPPSPSTVLPTVPQDWLVEPHFRAKFADRATLPVLGGVSAGSPRRTGRVGEEERKQKEEEEAVVDDDEEDEEGGEVRLPRTKSQLTTLLERDRGVGGAAKAGKGVANGRKSKGEEGRGRGKAW
ncbi:hypothetical protein MMC26_006219 [Xylographa opegraphella]|nr:hypothetical protein [Xylographa opegraphella]